MANKHPDIVVIGAGAVGGIVGGMLSKAGYPVEMVCKYPDLAETIKSTGLHITGILGDHRVTMPAVADVDQLRGKKDIVLLATKANEMASTAEAVIPFLKENSMVVSMQNGICEEELEEIVGPERTISCIVGWGATMHQPGELEMTSVGDFVIGSLLHPDDPRLPLLKSILETIHPVNISYNIMGYLYSKLIVNSCITTLGAISGLYLGKILARKPLRDIFIQIMEEAMNVANAYGIAVEAYGGKLDYYRFLKNKSFIGTIKRHMMLRLMGMKYKKLKSSSLQSLERGKSTEIDYLNGYYAKLARLKNVPVPLTDKLIHMVKEIEAGERTITPDNFKEL
ncbi:MAG: 2-dehydropantoate 2-reductase [bacterium]|nr:2-dehydropantoate 2-reductase [bacterium]